MSQRKDRSNDPDLEKAKMLAEARVALLAYYRDQLISHATILLTLGLVTFGALQAWQDGWSILRVPTILCAASIGTWQAFRLVLYGRLTYYVTFAAPKTETEMQSRLEADGYTGDKRALGEPTDLFALALRVGDLATETSQKGRQETSKWGEVVYLLAHPRPARGWQGTALWGYVGLPIVFCIAFVTWETCRWMDTMAFCVWLLLSASLWPPN